MSEMFVVAAGSGGEQAAAVTGIVDAATQQARESAVAGAVCGMVQTNEEESN